VDVSTFSSTVLKEAVRDGTRYDRAYDLAVHSSGALIAGGNFFGTIDADPGPLTHYYSEEIPSTVPNLPVGAGDGLVLKLIPTLSTLPPAPISRPIPPTAPRTLKLVANLPLISDRNVGQVFNLTATFSESMDLSSRPTFAFSAHAADQTLTFVKGHWVTPKIYQATFQAKDANVNLPGIGVTVSGAHGQISLIQTPATFKNVFSIDTTNPVVTSIRQLRTPGGSAKTLTFQVTFSAPVFGVDVSDFRLATSGLQGARVVSVTETKPGVFVVAVSTGTGKGTLRLDFLNNKSIKGQNGNAVAGARLGDELIVVGEAAARLRWH
jgi:hypothetical protein